MKLLNAKVYWYENYMNPAKIMVLVDKVPQISELIYEVVETKSGTAYCATKSGYVNYCYKIKGNSNGFGGATLNLITRHGKVAVFGPWSSRSSEMNKLFPNMLSIEALLTSDPEGFKKGCTFISGAITIEFAEKALRLVHPSVRLSENRGSSGSELDFYIDKEYKKLYNL